MTLKRLIPVVIGITIPHLPAIGSELGSLAGYLNPEDLAMASKVLGEKQDAPRKKGKKKTSAVVESITDLDGKVVAKTKKALRDLVINSDEKDNKAFQGQLEMIREYSFQFFLKKLPEVGQDGRPDDLNKASHAKIWRDAMNAIYDEVKVDATGAAPVSVPVAVLGDDEEDEGDDAAQALAIEKTTTYKTTLLNLLMRRPNPKELPLKVQTLIEHGADKNLNPEFNISPKMSNQAEYPLKIALDEISDEKTRMAILQVLLNDRIIYSNADKIDKPAGSIETLQKTLQVDSNANYVLQSLLEKDDFTTFNDVLTYLERCNIFVSETYNDQISQIQDQIYFPILENILEKMRQVRTSAISTDKNGKRVDNIEEFFSSKHLRGHLSRDNHDARFGKGFRERLKRDFQPLFDKISADIDFSRNETELHGDEIQGKVIEWSKWANFRNRVAVHLNKFALTASNEAEKSNVIKLIRYANIANESGIVTMDDEVFRELRTFGGKDIIFMRRNKYGWTPLMYAMVQKQSEGIQLYLRQAPHEVTLTDGVDNNLMHLAFPLPDEMFQGEDIDGDKNVLQMVGAQIGVRDVREKTKEALISIISEKSVDKKDKVRALKQLSAANFTPVSLAAAMGFVDIYDYLKEWLKGENEWNRDDHAHLDSHIEELVVIGLQSYIKVKEELIKSGQIKPEKLLAVQEEIHKMQAEIVIRQKEIDELKGNSIQEIYHPESELARQLLEEIMKPVKTVLDEYENKKGTKRSKDPYSEAFEAAFKMMLNPPKIEKMVKDRRPVTRVHKKKREVRVPRAKILGFTVLKDKIVTEEYPVEVTHFEEYDRPVFEPSILAGMKHATSTVKASYLGQVIKTVMARYLQHHGHPRYLQFSAVYKGLTESEALEYFQERFNATVEKKMQEVIRESLRAADRLRADELEEQQTNNRFDNMGSGGSVADDMRDFGREDAPSDDDDDDDDGDDLDVL